MTFITLFLILSACYFNAVCDAIIFNDSFASLGKWFSRAQILKGRDEFYVYLRVKHKLPLWLCKFLAFDVFIVFLDCWHFSKFLMIGCFSFAVSTQYGIFIWLGYSLVFSPIYSLVKKV
jgi:hypothetical protein